jgi:hypothetical protein
MSNFLFYNFFYFIEFDGKLHLVIDDNYLKNQDIY